MKLHIGNMYNLFDAHRNEADAKQMKDYMKGQFEYFGIKTKPRRVLTKKHNENLDLAEKDFLTFAKICFDYPEREMHHYALDTIASFKKKFTKKSIKISEFFCEKNAWWDTIDMSNSFINFHVFKKDKNLLEQKAREWKDDENFWKRRLAIISQLKFKTETDKELLREVIESNLGSGEFFINKAIGWALREYGHYKPEWVLKFVEQHTLEPLSQREALRKIV